MPGDDDDDDEDEGEGEVDRKKTKMTMTMTMTTMKMTTFVINLISEGIFFFNASILQGYTKLNAENVKYFH